MSLEISQETIGQVYASLADERVQDLTLVVASTVAAEREGRVIDDRFVEELAQDRLEQAREYYDFPVARTMPTLRSSLRQVRDIMTIRHLEATREERLAGVDLRGAGDIALSGAVGAEHHHRLWEKGILRIYDQHTSRSMWSVDFDHLVNNLGPERIQAISDKLVKNQLEQEDSFRSPHSG